METLKNVKVGDTVIRNLHGIKMPLKVTKIEGDLIICGWWDFNKQTGYEVDEDLGWDGVTKSGSYIIKED